MAKVFVSPDDLRRDSFKLGKAILDDGFHPDFMIALWRGGAAIGCHVHELFKFRKLKTDHIAIRTSRYTGLDTAADHVEVFNLTYVIEKVGPTTKLLIVDDISDTGLSIEALIETLQKKLGDQMPHDFRIATVYYKPSRNETGRAPNYFIHTTDKWIVFPHELEGLSDDEIIQSMGTELALVVFA